MPTVDLSTPAPAPEGTLEALPRRVALTLPELQLLAEHADGAPLPFELVEDGAGDTALAHRLGGSRTATDDEARRAALATLHDPAESLARRGLLGDAGVERGIRGALGLLAVPQVAVDLDVSIDGARARAWHRQRGEAVATLATADGLVFELAWFEAAAWPAELARVATLPEDHPTGPSAVPAGLDLPYELLDAGTEAVRAGRTDLLATVAAHHAGGATDPDGRPLTEADVVGAVGALAGETRGRLRALVADVEAGSAVVGVVSWVLVRDGWRALLTHEDDGTPRVEVRRVEPPDLAGLLGPVVAGVGA